MYAQCGAYAQSKQCLLLLLLATLAFGLLDQTSAGQRADSRDSKDYSLYSDDEIVSFGGGSSDSDALSAASDEILDSAQLQQSAALSEQYDSLEPMESIAHTVKPMRNDVQAQNISLNQISNEEYTSQEHENMTLDDDSDEAEQHGEKEKQTIMPADAQQTKESISESSASLSLDESNENSAIISTTLAPTAPASTTITTTIATQTQTPTSTTSTSLPLTTTTTTATATIQEYVRKAKAEHFRTPTHNGADGSDVATAMQPTADSADSLSADYVDDDSSALSLDAPNERRRMFFMPRAMKFYETDAKNARNSNEPNADSITAQKQRQSLPDQIQARIFRPASVEDDSNAYSDDDDEDDNEDVAEDDNNAAVANSKHESNQTNNDNDGKALYEALYGHNEARNRTNETTATTTTAPLSRTTATAAAITTTTTTTAAAATQRPINVPALAGFPLPFGGAAWTQAALPATATPTAFITTTTIVPITAAAPTATTTTILPTGLTESMMTPAFMAQPQTTTPFAAAAPTTTTTTTTAPMPVPATRIAAGGKQGKQIKILRPKLLPHKLLRNYIEDAYIRMPLAVIVDPSAESLEKTKALWRDALHTHFNIKIVLVALNASGIPAAYNFNNTRQFLAGLNSIKEHDGGNAFIGIVHASELVPYDSALFLSTAAIPRHTELVQDAAITLLKKRIRLYLIWHGERAISENETQEAVGGILGEVAIRSGGDILHIVGSENSQELEGSTLTLIADALRGSQELEIPVDTTLSSLHVKIDAPMRLATLETPHGG